MVVYRLVSEVGIRVGVWSFRVESWELQVASLGVWSLELGIRVGVASLGVIS